MASDWSKEIIPPERRFVMNTRPVELGEIKSVLVGRIGFDSKEAEGCLLWTHPELIRPLKSGDKILAELTKEEQGFFRCIGFAFNEKKADPMRLTALRDTFWTAVKNSHNLPSARRLTVKEGRYIVEK